MGKWTRRGLIGAGGLLAITGVAYGGGLLACRMVPRHTPDFFASLPGMDHDALRTIGQSVLRDHPGLARPGAATRLLTAKAGIERAIGTDCPQTRMTMVQEECRADFAAGRIVLVDGWMISETEALISAEAATA
ncbi:hypothetical protein [Cucumibacter marinus]|uniref:hypothetical protein n=1 Tax=Cucumibacter marinus TaxID=1121252 RepID=UPI0004227F21|nr:hypothetical protein [Cucumibacter marinus]